MLLCFQIIFRYILFTKHFLVFRVDKSEMNRDSSRGRGGYEDCFIRMRGLPYETSQEEIAQFFSGKME